LRNCGWPSVEHPGDQGGGKLATVGQVIRGVADGVVCNIPVLAVNTRQQLQHGVLGSSEHPSRA